MIIPISSDNPLGRRPLMNYALIAANVVIFLLTYNPHLLPNGSPVVLHDFAVDYKLFPAGPFLHQFITYAFLHANGYHIIGNMYFLYVFGNNVNDKLGNLGYLLLYLAGAIFSGLAHALFTNVPVLGASGAVAAVTGAYMVFFPNTYLRVLYWFLFIGTFEIRALYFILFKLIFFDNWLGPALSAIPSNVAYTAHLAGYSIGIGLPMLMLVFKLLPHSHYDLWALVRRWRRRRMYSRVVSRGYDPYAPTTVADRRKKVKVKVVRSASEAALSEHIMTVRAEIDEAIRDSDLAAAAAAYLRLSRLDAEQVLAQQPQLDIANKLMHDGRHTDAAGAYELFIAHYPRYPFIEQVQLMLGLIYSRYLKKKDVARQHLQAALAKLTDPGQQRMCQQEIDRM